MQVGKFLLESEKAQNLIEEAEEESFMRDGK